MHLSSVGLSSRGAVHVKKVICSVMTVVGVFDPIAVRYDKLEVYIDFCSWMSDNFEVLAAFSFRLHNR